MQFFVGTSGYSYKEWKGTFYPEKLPQKEMLGYYAQRFSTVELNNTFYRMPTVSGVESWAQQVPDSFRFVMKAPQAITHHKRLKNVEAETDGLLRAASVLKERQGPLLFQLPPNLKKDLSRLEDFLGIISNRAPAAFEFRHESWFDDEVFDCLRANSCALCIADMDDSPTANLVGTANWGYTAPAASKLYRRAPCRLDRKTQIPELARSICVFQARRCRNRRQAGDTLCRTGRIVRHGFLAHTLWHGFGNFVRSQARWMRFNGLLW